MLFEEYDPREDKMLQIIDNDGQIINSQWKPDIPDDMVLDAYKFMNYSRTADLMAVSYQRQGRIYTYPPNQGQEAVVTGIGKLMRKQDWLVPSFREMGAWLLKGARLRDFFLYFGGNEDGSKFSGTPNFLPSAVPVASQLTHAAGIGYAVKYKKQDSVVFTFTGDGSTSEGDFHESLNFASLWKAPVIFTIQNNQYAISVPVKHQTASVNLAIKSLAYGLPGIKVDGNDFFAVYKAGQEAVEYARAGKGPVLIEAFTFRRGAHTTSDDPSRYRSEEEEKAWAEKDPIKRLRGYLVSKNLWKPEDDQPLLEEFKKEVEKEFAEYENYLPYKVEDMFKYLYNEMPEDLKNQQIAYEKFLNWKEAKK